MAFHMTLEPTHGFHHRERKYFTQDGQEFHYDVFNANGPPAVIFGSVGDIAVDGEVVWYRGPKTWEVASKEVDLVCRPIQKHPIFKSKRRLEGLEWKAQTTWNTRKRKLDELNGDAIPNKVEQPRTLPYCISKTSGMSHAPYDFIHRQNMEISWLLELWSLWDAPPISRITPVKDIGFDILRELISHHPSVPKSPLDDSTLILLQRPSNFGNSPTLGHVIRDLIHPDNHNVFDFVNQYGDPDIEYPEFILSMLRSGEGHAWEDTCRLYGALNIRESTDGIGSCHLNPLPYSQEQESIVDEDGWVSTWTPPGAISHTHMDYYGSMQYFIHFYGKKLWLLWPPTPRNLECFASQHKQRANSNRTLDCIRLLEGLQLHYVDNSEQFFILKPNTLHACMSFSSCCHTGVQVWNLNHFDESYRMMEWGITWIKTSFYGSLGQSRAELLEEVDTIRHEAEKWRILGKRNSKHPSNAGVKVKFMTHKVSDLRSLLSISPPKPSTAKAGSGWNDLGGKKRS